MSKLPKYKITIDESYSNGEDLGIDMIAFTANPAIKVKGMAFTSAKKEVVKQHFADEVKMRIAAPALIPAEIYRNDEDGEYFVEFTVEEIEIIHQKFMSNLSNSGKFNLEHDNKKTVPAFILETWIVSDPEKDKSLSFGIEVPRGTLMVVAQITDKAYYQSLVDNEQVGFSIEGFLGLKLSDIKIAEELITIDSIKNKNKNNKLKTMIIPEGTKFKVDGKSFFVKDGEVIADETTEVVLEDESTVEAAVEPAEEVKAADAPVDEIKPEDKPVEEVKAAEPVLDEAAILAIIQPKLDELYKIIADLKVGKEKTEEDTTVEVEIPKTEMSIHERFSAISKFNKEK